MSATKHKPEIIIVDDEPMVTMSIKSFLELETDYNVHSYKDPKQVLEDLDFVKPDVVISDFLMPEMNGLELLDEIKHKYPDIPLILLTGYADKENAIKSINEIGLFQFIQKPWDNDHLKMVIDNALQHKNLQAALREKINELDEMMAQREKFFQEKSLFTEELELARQVYSKYLPEEKQKLGDFTLYSFFKPKFRIGGDFFDVIPLQNNRFAIIIADLTGHGIQAALCVALLKFAFSEFKNSNADIQEIVLGINTVMKKGLPGNAFTAALLVILDTKNHSAQILNAGIPHPLLLKRQENRVKHIHANGLLLGVVDNDLYVKSDPFDISLQPNDCLVLFSDGLSEIDDRADLDISESLTEKILLRLEQHHGRQLLQRVQKFSKSFFKNREFKDDVTILALECIK